MQDLLLCAKHVFVAAMVAGVHPGPARTGKSEHEQRGQSAFEAMKFSGAAKASAAVDPRFIGESLLSRPALGAGLVALRQLFVRRCHGGLGSPRPAANVLLCAKHLFVATMVAGVHARLKIRT